MIVLCRRFQFYLVLYGGLCSTPPMAAALAGVIHDRQSAEYEQRHSEDDQYGGFHCDLATAGPNTYRSRFYVVQNEPTVNAQPGAGTLTQRHRQERSLTQRMTDPKIGTAA
jgi:hypothetical protein